MVARTVSNIRMFTAVATSLGAIATIFAPSLLRAQQLAATDIVSDRQAYLASECNHIRDLNERTGCYGEATIRFTEMLTAGIQKERAVVQKRIDETDQRIEQITKENEAHRIAIAEARCSTEVAQGLKSGDTRFAPERGRTILKGQHPRDFGWCRFLERLKS